MAQRLGLRRRRPLLPVPHGENATPVIDFSQSLVETAAMPGLGRNFWRLWSASALSNVADGAVRTALPLVTVTVTRSPSLVAGVSVALGLPWLVFSLQAGALADRLD